MDWEADRKMLERIAALLVSFAALAEQAAGRSAPVRFLVLWALRFAEAIAAEFVFDATGAPPPAVEGFTPEWNSREEAMLLGWRFRALAAALGALLVLAGPCGRRRARIHTALRRFAQCFGSLAVVLGGLTPRPHDTS